MLLSLNNFYIKPKYQILYGKGNIRFCSKREDVIILLSNMWNLTKSTFFYFYSICETYDSDNVVEINENKVINFPCEGRRCSRQYPLKYCLEQYLNDVWNVQCSQNEKCISLLSDNEWFIEVCYQEFNKPNNKLCIKHKEKTPYNMVQIYCL